MMKENKQVQTIIPTKLRLLTSFNKMLRLTSHSKLRFRFWCFFLLKEGKRKTIWATISVKRGLLVQSDIQKRESADGRCTWQIQIWLDLVRFWRLLHRKRGRKVWQGIYANRFHKHSGHYAGSTKILENTKL